MDFKTFLSKKDKEADVEHYWALIIEPNWVQAGIWKIEGEVAEILYTGIPVAWELDEDLVGACDASLSSAIQNFPEDKSEPTKVVFGVVSSWVKGGKILPEHLDKIKRLCGELSIKPVGFVVVSEAIAHFIKNKEGSPLNAVVIGIYKESIEISVFQVGDLLGNTVVSKSVSIVDDVVEGLSRFSKDISFPSRFILYDGREGELEDVRQSLFKVNWEDFQIVKFLHVPKIETFTIENKMSAVSFAGATEIAQVKSVRINESAATEIDNELVKKADFTDDKEEPSKSEESEDILQDEADAEILQGEETVENKDLETIRPEAEDSTGNEVNDLEIKPKLVGDNFQDVEVQKQEEEIPEEKVKISSPKFFSGFSLKFAGIFNLFKGILGVGRKPVLLGIVLLLLFLVGGFLWWWFFTKATVTVFVSPKLLNDNFEIVVDPKAEKSDFENKVISSRIEKVETSGEKTSQTTGVKTVGEKATGQVTIYRAGTPMTLPSGTVLKGPDSLKFTIDETTNLASGSAANPGVIKANVTALDIGAKYNLASGASFGVGNYSTSDIEAKNENSFSGGTSREISVVSEDDQKELEKDLTNELLSDGKTKLEEKITSEDFLIDASIKGKVKSDEFSGKVGDEASDLKLNLDLDIESLIVRRSDLNDISYEFIKEKVPQGYILKSEEISNSFKFIKEDGGKYRFKVEVKVNLLPDVDLSDVGKSILGKYPEVAKQSLEKTVPGFVKVRFDLYPNLPGRLGTLPRVVKNLELVLAAEK